MGSYTCLRIHGQNVGNLTSVQAALPWTSLTNQKGQRSHCGQYCHSQLVAIVCLFSRSHLVVLCRTTYPTPWSSTTTKMEACKGAPRWLPAPLQRSLISWIWSWKSSTPVRAFGRRMLCFKQNGTQSPGRSTHFLSLSSLQWYSWLESLCSGHVWPNVEWLGIMRVDSDPMTSKS